MPPLPARLNRHRFTGLHCKDQRLRSVYCWGLAWISKQPTVGTTLHRTVSSGNVEKVVALLQFGSNFHATNNLGETPLHTGVMSHGSEDEVEQSYIMRMASVGGAGHRVSRYADLRCVMSPLWRGGANIHAANNDQISLLLWAIHRQKLEHGT
jgi:ankyrin repeat protein